MRQLALICGALLFVGVGVGGTLGIQTVAGGESKECHTMNGIVGPWIEQFGQLKTAPTNEQLTLLDTAMDIRYKACHP